MAVLFAPNIVRLALISRWEEKGKNGMKSSIKLPTDIMFPVCKINRPHNTDSKHLKTVSRSMNQCYIKMILKNVLAVYSVLYSNSCCLVVICFHVFSLFFRAEQMPGLLLQWSSYQPPFLPSWPQISWHAKGLYSPTFVNFETSKGSQPWWQRCCSNAPLDRVEPWRQSATKHRWFCQCQWRHVTWTCAEEMTLKALEISFLMYSRPCI